MSVKTIIAWIDGEAKNIEVEDVAYVAPDLTIEDRIFALEKIQSPEFINSVTLYASNWIGEVSPYSQVVHIEGATQYSKIDLQPSTEQLTIFHEKDLAFVAENEDGVITVYCVGQKPTNDYTMQITMTEVVVNE
jgi:hypothetical protein